MVVILLSKLPLFIKYEKIQPAVLHVVNCGIRHVIYSLKLRISPGTAMMSISPSFIVNVMGVLGYFIPFIILN